MKIEDEVLKAQKIISSGVELSDEDIKMIIALGFFTFVAIFIINNLKYLEINQQNYATKKK